MGKSLPYSQSLTADKNIQYSFFGAVLVRDFVTLDLVYNRVRREPGIQDAEGLVWKTIIGVTGGMLN